ncbi:ABC transporter family substrate-binding protein [Gandjariella thermophila]|uniref:Peptide ABC transporter substrate-binding protein n=1 Tax=Gandjariella thermophila TaxID=1931992 RepID=A0A4D4J0H9_9PSEU|nr:ABC transporter family substrate-binding protein [Gandjariella thermophila]GDY29961.1 peptide ABC transporter substrate-binding protein [Gandjariella thermophila]
MRRSKAFAGFALSAAAALALSACGGGGGGGNGAPTGDVKSWATAQGEKNGAYSAPQVPQSNDTISVITDKPWNSYNNGTADASNSYNSFINVATLQSPFMLDGNNKVILNKDLMDSVEVTNQNPQTIVWKINPKAVWSDGVPVDCKDFYLAWLSNNGAAKDFSTASTTGYEQMQAPTCSDNGKTVTTVFTSPFSDWKSLFDITSNNLLPAHIVEQKTGIADITKLTPTSPPDQLKKAADFWNNGWKGFDKSIDLSDGPYVIDGWVQNQSITLVRNPKWWGNPGGPAKITVKWARDLVAQAQALQNNEVQVQFSAQPDANGSDKLKSLSSQGVTYAATPGLSFEHLDLNFKNPLFQDEAVRKAFFQCVNRNELVDKLIKPIESDAKPAGALMFFPGEQGLPDNYSDKSTGNANQAKQTLQAAGWQFGPDGVATKNGQRLAFSISHTDIPRRTQTVQLIQSECKAAGFDIADKTDPNFLNGPVSAGQYDVALFAWSQAPFKSSSISVYKTGGGQNWQGLTAPAADQAFTQALAQTSQEAAIPYYQQAEKAISETYGTLPLFNTPNQWAFAQGMKGVYYQSYNGALWDANEWQKTS